LVGGTGLSKYTQKSRPGTSVIVRDLFYKYPIRRRKVASNHQYAVVLESVKRLVMNFALCFNYLGFTLIDNNRNTRILVVKNVSSRCFTLCILPTEPFFRQIVA
jgi:DNA mismatch repair ATPase MutL